MQAGQLAQSHGDGVSDKGGDDVTQDHAGPGDFQSGGRAEEKSGADGAPDGNHGHLAGGKLMVEALFVDLFLGRLGGARGMRHDNKGMGHDRV